MRVAYLLPSFPNTSETFIINEIAEAQRQGVEVGIFSIYRPASDCPHETARSLAASTTYLLDPDSLPWSRQLLLHVRGLLRYNRHYLRSLLFALRNRENATLWTFRVAAYYAESLREFAPDVIHTHFAYDSSRLTMMTAKMMGVPFTITIHGWADLYGHPPPDLQKIMLNAKTTVTVCDYNRRYILDTYGIPKERIRMIRCGIPAGFFRATSDEQRQEGLLVSVGRLHYHKAFHVLLDACRILADRGIPFRCLIVGEGELRDQLEAQIKALRLEERVELLGARSNEEVRKLLLRAEIFILSSAVEIAPLAVMEALGSGVPVVATRLYGVPEMVLQNETGLLSEPGDANSTAACLATLLSSRELRRSMGATGRSLVMREHDLSVQVAKLVGVWQW